MALERQAPGEDVALLLARQRHGGAQQRVFGGAEAERARVAGAGLRAKPVAAALEGVGGQLDAARGAVGEERLPVDRDAVDVGFGQRCEEGLERRLLRALAGGDERRLRWLLLQALGDQRAECAVGAELEEAGDAGLAQRADAVGEAHRLSDVGRPVGRGDRLLLG